MRNVHPIYVSVIALLMLVERPASVVKELVENALDAGATEVRLELEGGGKSRILVADDGSGMGRDDALLAFDEADTSEDGEVFADSLPADRQAVSKDCRGRLAALEQQVEHLASRRLGYRREHRLSYREGP